VGGALCEQLTVGGTVCKQLCALALAPWACTGGTLKFELPTSQVTLPQVFAAVSEAKAAGHLQINDWCAARAGLLCSGQGHMQKLTRALGQPHAPVAATGVIVTVIVTH
jgi:hypothetical protein